MIYNSKILKFIFVGTILNEEDKICAKELF
ncbi:MAG: hypothetical protein ACJAXS_001407 [Colwellia sp.]|jgi:hypothetical protein